MARKKSRKSQQSSIELNTIDIKNVGAEIAKLIETKLEEEFGKYIDPDIELVKTNIRPLDAVIGGGILVGHHVMISGAAEIGKTTFAWQLIKNLFSQYENSIALYVDIEGSAACNSNNPYIKTRIELMNIDKSRLIYKSMTLSIEEFFKLVSRTVEIKRKIDEQLGIQTPMFVIWDSIADTEPEKIDEVDDPNKMIGYKARTIQFHLGKYKPLFRRNKVTLIMIDQIRANITSNISNMYQKQEKQIGVINDLKSATGSRSVEHKLRQWFFLIQGPEIYDKDDIIGWYLDFHIIKSKLAPSGFTIRTVFDKRYGIDKFWTEYHFISNLAPFEEKIYKKLGGSQNKRAVEYKSNIESILGVQSSGAYKYLQYIDSNTGEIITSQKFYEKDVKKLYETDKSFRELFDKVVEQNIHERIIKYFSNNEIKNVLEEETKEELQIQNKYNINDDNIDLDETLIESN